MSDNATNDLVEPRYCLKHCPKAFSSDFTYLNRNRRVQSVSLELPLDNLQGPGASAFGHRTLLSHLYDEIATKLQFEIENLEVDLLCVLLCRVFGRMLS